MFFFSKFYRNVGSSLSAAVALRALHRLIKNVHNKKIYGEQLCRLTLGTARRAGRAGWAPTFGTRISITRF